MSERRIAQVGDLVKCHPGNPHGTPWLVTDENAGVLYGRALGTVFPSAMSAQPGDVEIIAKDAVRQIILLDLKGGETQPYHKLEAAYRALGNPWDGTPQERAHCHATRRPPNAIVRDCVLPIGHVGACSDRAPECAACFDEEGSLGCVRPSHTAWRSSSQEAYNRLSCGGCGHPSCGACAGWAAKYTKP